MGWLCQCCSWKKRRDRSYSQGKASEALFKPIIDNDLELVQVTVLFRHGARTPLTTISLLPDATYVAELGDDLPETMFPYEVVNINTGQPVGTPDIETALINRKLLGGCKASVLTTVGQRQMFALGKQVRKFYLDALQIKNYSPETVGARCTHLERCIKSLRCFLAGVFGAANLGKVEPVIIPVKKTIVEDLFPNKLSCTIFRRLLEKSASGIQYIPGFLEDRAKLLDAFDLPYNCNLDFSAVRDDLVCRVVHGNLCPPFLLPHLDTIEKNASRNIHYVYSGQSLDERNRALLIQLAVGRLFYDLLQQMRDVIIHRSILKLQFLCGHDTTLVPMMDVFGSWANRWPGFGYSFTWELYRCQSRNSYYVRVLSCGKPLKLKDKSDFLLPFSEFEAYLDRFSISHDEYWETCSRGVFPL